MKNLLACLAVIVYMNSGKMYTFPEGKTVYTNGNRGGFLEPGVEATVLKICKTAPIHICRPEDVIVEFSLINVERWEIK